MPTDRIQRFFLETRGFAPAELPGPGEPLFEGGFLDSLATIEFVTFLEQEFDVTLSDDEVVLENFETIDAVAALIDRKRMPL